MSGLHEAGGQSQSSESSNCNSNCNSSESESQESQESQESREGQSSSSEGRAQLRLVSWNVWMEDVVGASLHTCIYIYLHA